MSEPKKSSSLAEQTPNSEAADRRHWKLSIWSKRSSRRLMILSGIIAASLVVVYFVCMSMPGRSFRGSPAELTADQVAAADRMRAIVEKLATDIGPRNPMYRRNYGESATFLESELAGLGYEVRFEVFSHELIEGANIIVEVPGRTRPEAVLVIGAHYDSCESSPAANDNASGVAAVVELARRFHGSEPGCTLRFICFANEEPPFFKTEAMGSLAHARGCRERGEDIIGAISVETIGYYDDTPGSQNYPVAPLGLVYPSAGNFVAFVGNLSSRSLVRRGIESFRAVAEVASEGAALPGWIEGVAWSDQWAFWQCGYPGIMVTDTAPYRYEFYHTEFDTPDKLDFGMMSRVVDGLESMILELSGGN